MIPKTLFLSLAGVCLIACGAGRPAHEPLAATQPEPATAPQAAAEREPVDEPRPLAALSEAFYELSWAGNTYATASLESRGVELSVPDETPVIRVTMRIENLGDEPIRIDTDQVRLESVQTASGILTDIKPTIIAGQTTIAPGETGKAVLHFIIPTAEVNAYRVAWFTQTDAHDMAQYTAFIHHEDTAVVPVYAYEDPYQPNDQPLYAAPATLDQLDRDQVVILDR